MIINLTHSLLFVCSFISIGVTKLKPIGSKYECLERSEEGNKAKMRHPVLFHGVMVDLAIEYPSILRLYWFCISVSAKTSFVIV